MCAGSSLHSQPSRLCEIPRPINPFVDLLVDLLLGSGPKSAVVHVDALLDVGYVGTTAGPVTSGRSDHRQEHWA